MGADLQRVARVFVHILCFAACVVGVAAVLTLLAGLAGSDTAHAESVPHDEPPALETATVDHHRLWAEPRELVATAARRASGSVAERAPESATRDETPIHRPSSEPTPGANAFEDRPAVTTPVGSLAAGGAPDSGPSIAQLAVLSAALMGVRWLSQGLRAIELSWRNALVSLHVERPG